MWVQFGLLALVLSAQGLPQFSDKRQILGEPMKDVPGPQKNYTGVRISNTSQLMIYYHEQTIAVVELGKRSLLNCELLEVKTERDRTAALKQLNLIKKQIRIGFKEMLDLMDKCQDIPAAVAPNSTENQPSYSLQLFQGIFPGTKWCGRGDIADNYFDLGEEAADKCCRLHDLCPVKVAAFATQYNITNLSIVSRSHCECDAKFLQCLKNTDSSISDLIGNMYFNIAQLSCVDEHLNDNNIKNFIFQNSKLNYQL